LELGDRLKCW